MRVKVNNSEVEWLTKQLELDTNDLNEEIEGYLKDIKTLEQGYQSFDSEYLIETYNLFLEKMKTIPYTLNELNDVIKKANNMYVDKDSEFKLELKKTNNEEQEYEQRF